MNTSADASTGEVGLLPGKSPGVEPQQKLARLEQLVRDLALTEYRRYEAGSAQHLTSEESVVEEVDARASSMWLVKTAEWLRAQLKRARMDQGTSEEVLERTVAALRAKLEASDRAEKSMRAEAASEGAVLRGYLQRLCASVREARARALLRRLGGDEGPVPVPSVLLPDN